MMPYGITGLERVHPQSGVGPSISSSVVLCSFVLLVCIVMLVLIFYLCPSSVRVVATFSGIVLFPLLYSVFPFFFRFFSSSNFVIPSKCLKHFICAASKRCSSLFLSTQASLPNFNPALAVMLWILNFVSLFNFKGFKCHLKTPVHKNVYFIERTAWADMRPAT